MHALVVALLAGVLIGRVSVRIKHTNGRRVVQLGLQLEGGCTEDVAQRLRHLVTVLFCRVLLAGFNAHFLQTLWYHRNGPIGWWALSLLMSAVDCAREAGLTIWSALSPSSFLAHVRTANRVALASMVISKLCHGVVTATSDSVLVNYDLVGVAVQCLLLILNQEEPLEYATQAGMLVVSAFVCHAWGLAHQPAPTLLAPGNSAGSLVDWPEEVLNFLVVFCALMLVHAAYMKLVNPPRRKSTRRSTNNTGVLGEGISREGGFFRQGTSSILDTATTMPCSLLSPSMSVDPQRPMGPPYLSSTGSDSLKGMAQRPNLTRSPAHYLGLLPNSRLVNTAAAVKMHPLFKFKLIMVRMTCISIFAAFALMTTKHLLAHRATHGPQAAWELAWKLWPSTVLVPLVLLVQFSAFVLLLTAPAAFYLKHVRHIRMVVYYMPLATRLLMLLAEPAAVSAGHIAVSLNPSTFIYFALSSLAHEDGLGSHLLTTATTGITLLTAKAHVLGLLPTLSLLRPLTWVTFVTTWCGLVRSHPAYVTATIASALAYPMLSQGRIRPLPRRARRLESHTSRGRANRQGPTPQHRVSWGLLSGNTFGPNPLFERKQSSLTGDHLSSASALSVAAMGWSSATEEPVKRATSNLGRPSTNGAVLHNGLACTVTTAASGAVSSVVAVTNHIELLSSQNGDCFQIAAQGSETGNSRSLATTASSFQQQMGSCLDSPTCNTMQPDPDALADVIDACDDDIQPADCQDSQGDEQPWLGVISAPVAVSMGLDIGEEQSLPSWLLQAAGSATAELRRQGTHAVSVNGLACSKSLKALTEAFSGGLPQSAWKGIWPLLLSALGMDSLGQLQPCTVQILGCALLVAVRVGAAFSSLQSFHSPHELTCPAVIALPAHPLPRSSGLLSGVWAVLASPLLLPLMGHVACVGYSIGMLVTSVKAPSAFAKRRSTLWVAQLCFAALVQQLCLHALAQARTDSPAEGLAKEPSSRMGSHTPNYLSYPVLSMLCMSVMWPILDLKLATYKATLLLRLVLTLIMSCVFVLDQCVAEPQLLALVALRAMIVMVVAYALSHEALEAAPKWVNRLAASYILNKQRPARVSRLLLKLFRSREHISCLFLGLLLAGLLLPFSQKLASGLLSFDSPALQSLQQHIQTLLLHVIHSNQQQGSVDRLSVTDSLLPRELLGPLTLLMTALLAGLLLRALDLISSSQVQRQHWYEDQARGLQFLSEQRLDLLGPKQLVEVLQVELPGLWYGSMGGLLLLDRSQDETGVAAELGRKPQVHARAATLAPLTRYFPVALPDDEVTFLSRLLLRSGGEMVAVVDVLAEAEAHPSSHEAACLLSLREHMHVSSLTLVPFMANGLVVGGFFALSPDPCAHDAHFLRALKVLASLLGSAMLLSKAMQDVRAGDLIIDDVMPRQVADMLKKQAAAQLSAISDTPLATSSGVYPSGVNSSSQATVVFARNSATFAQACDEASRLIGTGTAVENGNNGYFLAQSPRVRFNEPASDQNIRDPSNRCSVEIPSTPRNSIPATNGHALGWPAAPGAGFSSLSGPTLIDQTRWPSSPSFAMSSSPPSQQALSPVNRSSLNAPGSDGRLSEVRFAPHELPSLAQRLFKPRIARPHSRHSCEFAAAVELESDDITSREASDSLVQLPRYSPNRQSSGTADSGAWSPEIGGRQANQAARTAPTSACGAMLSSGQRSPVTSLLQGQLVYKQWHESVTVLFCDIVGYTAMSQELEPEQVMLLLHELFTKYDRLADKWGVYKVETIGDCYMACTGVTSPDPRHAATLLAFAVDMVHAAASVTNPLAGGPVRVRVGLHSGRVMSGIVGLQRARYCLFGDTVNTASRMESTGLPEMLQVSEATYTQLDARTQQSLMYRGEIEVKGKGVMRTYLLDPLAGAN